MTSYLTILKTHRGAPATKSFVRDESSAVTQLPIRMSRHFSVERRAIETIYDLSNTLTELNSSPSKFVIRGEPTPGTNLNLPVRRIKYSDGETRATFRSSKKGESWVCFDFDKIDCPVLINPVNDAPAAIRFLVGLLPTEFHDVTFWAQWSSSSGLDGWETLSSHLWFLLDRPVTDDNLRLWADSTNTPIDTSLFNAVQPHFTAAPIFADDVADPCPNRHMLMKGTCDVATINFSKTNDWTRGKTDSRKARSHSKRTRPAPRIEGTASGSSDPEMGEWRRDDKWPGSNRAKIHAEIRNAAVIDFLTS